MELGLTSIDLSNFVHVIGGIGYNDLLKMEHLIKIRIAHLAMNAPAVGGQYPLPDEKIEPCHLCPHNRHDARQPAQPNPVDTNGATG